MYNMFAILVKSVSILECANDKYTESTDEVECHEFCR